jgi:hypothetical protein
VNQFLSNDYKIENVAKKGKAGDFMLKWRSYKTNKVYKIIIDVKNYKSTVPGREVDKFYRDTNINNVDGGFLLSLNAKIVGISKIIEFKEFLSDKGQIPMMFVNSNTPELIAEVIKLLFHMVEIRDLSKSCSNIQSDELALRINDLNDNIQMMTQCRETLHVSKTTIEKSLNNIMMQLMSCEYSLIGKINQINAQITDRAQLNHIVDVLPGEEKNEENAVSHALNMFSNTITDADIVMLNQIYATQTWTHTSINIPKRTWQLTKGDNMVHMRFMKTNTVMIFPIILDGMIETIASMRKDKKIRPDTITQLLELCQML